MTPEQAGPAEKELSLHDIPHMDELSLVALCHGKICEEDGCYRQCEHGYRFCIQCIHGQSERADDFYVAAKKRLEKLQKKNH